MDRVPNRFYVYRHIRLDTGEVFYVGKGSGRRAWEKYNRSFKWHEIADNFGYRIEIIFNYLIESEAFAIERKFISFYRNQGHLLLNKTDGGEGTSRPGFTWSQEHNDRVAQSLGGRPFEVYKLPHFELVGTWSSISQCERDLNVGKNSISPILHKRTKRSKNYTIKYVDDLCSIQELYGTIKEKKSKKVNNRVKKERKVTTAKGLQGQFWIGKIRPEETKQKMRLAKLGKKRKPFTIKHKENMSIAYWTRHPKTLVE